MEPLLLYLVFFFPGYFSLALGGISIINETIPFSTIRELGRLLAYTLPAFSLLWYLILEKKSLLVSVSDFRPKKEDLFSLIWGLPGLILTGMIISLVVTRFSFPSSPGVQAPGDFSGWIVMVLSCIGTGYLEESFFRFYLYHKLEDWISSRYIRILISVLFFCLCHLYEGGWGILNAALAGILLSVIYEHYGSLHGIAWAHASYNVFVYFMGIFL